MIELRFSRPTRHKKSLRTRSSIQSLGSWLDTEETSPEKCHAGQMHVRVTVRVVVWFIRVRSGEGYVRVVFLGGGTGVRDKRPTFAAINAREATLQPAAV